MQITMPGAWLEHTGHGRTLLAALLSFLLTSCVNLSGSRSEYDRLVSELSAGRSDDWGALDAAFLRLPDFPQRLEELGALHARESEQPDNRESIARRMLNLYYGDLRAHELLHRAALARNDTHHAAFHAASGNALTAAIADSGDGSNAAPFRAITMPQAHAWLKKRRLEVLGAFYKVDDAAPTLLLVTKIREKQAEHIDTLHFDLTPTYLAAVKLATVIGGGEGLMPSQVVAARAASGDSAAQITRARELMQEDPSRALQWLHAASKRSNLVARELLGTIYISAAASRTGEDAHKLLDAAVEQLLLAVSQGSAEAMYNLAQFYLSGHFGEENQSAGIPLLKQASEREQLDATVMLARLRYSGRLVPEDRDAAVALLLIAAMQGHPEARLLYAQHLLGTDDGANFDDRAYHWLEEAAEHNHYDEAMLLLGVLHALGKHVEHDQEHALAWFKRAASSSRNAELVNNVAWILVVAEDRALRDATAGLSFMNKLMTEDTAAAANPVYIDTWAAAHAAVGDFETAMRLQRDAVARSEAAVPEGSEASEDLQILRKHLELFEAGGTITEKVP